MDKPKRIQRRRTRGWKMPPGAIYVGRPTRWGNPFTVGCEAWRYSLGVPYRIPQTLAEVLADYRYFADIQLLLAPDWLKPLRGKDLACWCALDKPCHADYLLIIANRTSTNGRNYQD